LTDIGRLLRVGLLHSALANKQMLRADVACVRPLADSRRTANGLARQRRMSFVYTQSDVASCGQALDASASTDSYLSVIPGIPRDSDCPSRRLVAVRIGEISAWLTERSRELIPALE